MPVDERWDLLVLGGGTAGIVGAKTAAALGARVALVERDRTGGDCLWTGCVPSKTLIAAAGHVAAAREGALAGVRVDGVEVDFADVLSHVRRSIATIEPVDSPSALEAAGVTVIAGDAHFVDGGTVDVGGRELCFRQALIATGAFPLLPPIPGLRESQPLTSDSLWDLPSLPRRLVVMGGGSIGCELGQAFARLGSEVTVVEALPGLLPREDPEAGTFVRDAMSRDGVEVLTGFSVTKVVGSPGEPGVVHGEDASGEKTVNYDTLLVAVGRAPRTAGLVLERAGVATDAKGFVKVDRYLRTSNRRIWAAGDVTPHPQFTHVAGVHGSLAASNAILGLRRAVNLGAVPRVTYTDPEVASVGVSTGGQDAGAEVFTERHADVDRAVTENRMDGFSRIAVDRRRRVVGATVVGPRAGEVLGELTLAVRRRMKVSALASTMHAYPTYGDGPWNAAIESVRQKVSEPITSRLVSWLVSARRQWVDARGDRS